MKRKSVALSAVSAALLATVPIAATLCAAVPETSEVTLSENSVAALSSKDWNPPKALSSPAGRELVRALATALSNTDEKAVRAVVAKTRSLLGKEAGRPEVAPDYSASPDPRPPATEVLLAAWLADAKRRLGQDPWDRALAARKAGKPPPRLRDSLRMARAYLWTADLVGPEEGAAFRERALAGLRYVRAQQAANGVFGYPYNPRRTDRIGVEAAKVVEEGKRRGRTMTDGVWIIDDLGRGGLLFDNGEAVEGLLEAHALTGDEAFRTAALRACAWAERQPLVANWNYNAFSGQALALAYLATREAHLLEAANRIFRVGVLPGQMENGRWLDPHNARTQYHAILTSSLLSWHAALTAARDPRAREARIAAELALDNLAAEARTYGAANLPEMLTVEALVGGLETFGPRPAWRDALHVHLNALTPATRSMLLQRVGFLPEPLPLALRALRKRVGKLDAENVSGP